MKPGESCPVCGAALPKGQSKLVRHFEKHGAIFQLRADQKAQAQIRKGMKGIFE